MDVFVNLLLSLSHSSSIDTKNFVWVAIKWWNGVTVYKDYHRQGTLDMQNLENQPIYMHRHNGTFYRMELTVYGYFVCDKPGKLETLRVFVGEGRTLSPPILCLDSVPSSVGVISTIRHSSLTAGCVRIFFSYTFSFLSFFSLLILPLPSIPSNLLTLSGFYLQESFFESHMSHVSYLFVVKFNVTATALT